LKKEMDDMELWAGCLQTGKRAVHQEIHVDNEMVFLSETMKKYMKRGGEPTMQECLETGYVVDIPLSREGAIIRVLYPSPDGKKLVMDYVYIPFGSMLVRSQVIFHSGHYGNPGNFRLHGVLCLPTQKIEDQSLGYMRRYMEKTKYDKDIKDLPVVWADHITEHFKLAGNAFNLLKETIQYPGGNKEMPRYYRMKGKSTGAFNEMIKNDGYGISWHMKMCLMVLNPHLHFDRLDPKKGEEEKERKRKMSNTEGGQKKGRKKVEDGSQGGRDEKKWQLVRWERQK
jgi:hypothetical protein